MAPQKPTPPPERVRDEVYGIRLEHVIEAAKPKAETSKPAPSADAVEGGGPDRPAWQSIEDQMANPTPGVRRRPKRT